MFQNEFSITLEDKQVPLSRQKRYILFSLILTLSLAQSMDQGAVSGSTKEIQEHFDIDNLSLGTLGSIVFIGNTLGCIVTFGLINRIHRKILLMGTTLILAGTYIIIAQVKYFVIVLIARFISGMMQSFTGIYSPVWCDQFGIYKNRSLFLALFHISTPFGYFAGYIIGMMVSWQFAYYISIILLIGHALVFLLFDNDFFSATLMPMKRNMTVERNDDDNVSMFEEVPSVDDKDMFSSLCKEFLACLKSVKFVLLNITLIFIYFVVSGIQFWINDYLENSLYIEKKEVRLYLFAAVVATSPILGIVLGGVIVKAIFGGYEHKNAILAPLIFALMVTLTANFVVISSSVVISLIALWIYLFFGSMTLPGLNGMVLCSVAKEFSGNASALSTFMYNVFGKFPAPNVYGFIKEKTQGMFNGKVPMVVLLNAAVFGLIALVVEALRGYKKENKTEDNNRLNEESEQIIN